MSHIPDPYQPKKHPANPGRVQSGKMDLLLDGRHHTESINILDVAVQVFQAGLYRITRRGDWLAHPESGFEFLPMILDATQLPTGAVRTTTTIQANHPSLIPAGVFEYQHSTGKSIDESIRKGIEGWMQGDVVALLDAARPQPRHCMRMDMQFPAKDGAPGLHRRAILGPPARFYLTKPSPTPAPAEGKDTGDAEAHDFCPCCLLTNSFQTFKSLIESSGFYALRLYAARDAEGKPMADCRVNGEDWSAGVPALQKYASTWKPTGSYEFRKQYVILQDAPGESEPS